jgi:hypothetical protein
MADPMTLADPAQHIDAPTSRHRCVVAIDTSRHTIHLRCLDCRQTLDPRRLAAPTLRAIPRPDQACHLHPGEWPDTCGRCRAERLGRPDDQPRPTPQPTADVAARVAECRAQLKPSKPKPSGPDVDRDALEQARAELAARQPVPTPDEETT